MGQPTEGDLPPYARAFSRCPSARLQEVPKRLKNDWRVAARTIAWTGLAAVRAGQEDQFAAAVRLFIELPARAFAMETPCHGAVRATRQRERLQRIAKGNIPPLPDPITPSTIATPAVGGPYPQERQAARAAARARRFVEQGLLSRAIKALEAGDPAPSNAETLERLQALHPPNPTPFDQWPDPPIVATPLRIGSGLVATIIKKLPRGLTSGPSAWTFEMIQEATRDEPSGPVCTFLAEIIQRAAEGRLCWPELFTASRLVGMVKPEGGVRPIAVGEALYRLIGRALLAADPLLADKHAETYVGMDQYGVAYPGGVEAPVHAVRELLDLDKLWAQLALDFANAYNTIDRVTTAEEIHQQAPAFAAFYEWSYRREALLILPSGFAAAGLLDSILSRAGVRQGDVLGPLFFAIGIAPVVKEVRALPGADPRAYLDDINVAITRLLAKEAVPDCVQQILETVQRAAARINLRLNLAKCVLWAPEDAKALLPYPGACRTATEGLKVLGAPLGTPVFVQEFMGQISARCRDSLALVVSADLPLQHKLLLVRNCVSQVPTFWLRTVPAAGPALEDWDAEVLQSLGQMIGLHVTPGSVEELVARQPVRLGGLGLRSAADQAPRAYASSLLFAAAVARERNRTVECGPTSARAMAAVLPEFVEAAVCPDADGWTDQMHEGEVPALSVKEATKLQRKLQGRAEEDRQATVRRELPTHLSALYEDAATPGTGRWLSALPTDPTLQVPDRQFRLALRAKLLQSPATALASCAVCRVRPVDASHPWTCQALSRLRIARHDAVVRRLHAMVGRQAAVREHGIPFLPTAAQAAGTPRTHRAASLAASPAPGSPSDQCAPPVPPQGPTTPPPPHPVGLGPGPVPRANARQLALDRLLGEARRARPAPTSPVPAPRGDIVQLEIVEGWADPPDSHPPVPGLLRADLWIPAKAQAVDVTIVASVGWPWRVALERAEDRKIAKYAPAVRARAIAEITPFALGAFGNLGKSANAFLAYTYVEREEKIPKARARLAIAAVRGTAMMIEAWQGNMRFLA